MQARQDYLRPFPPCFARSLRTVFAARVSTPVRGWYFHVVGSARATMRRNMTRVRFGLWD